MQPEAKRVPGQGVEAHPLSELLRCPEATSVVLNAAAECISYEAGQVVFRQGTASRGLYVVISGQYLRRTERLETRIALAPARPGQLVELAAVLGDARHTYTLSTQISGLLLLLPIDALNKAFQEHPPLRMHLLEELAREVSRGYDASCQNRPPKARRSASGAGHEG